MDNQVVSIHSNLHFDFYEEVVAEELVKEKELRDKENQAEIEKAMREQKKLKLSKLKKTQTIKKVVTAPIRDELKTKTQKIKL